LGWSEDQINFLLYPLAEGKEPIFSMGDERRRHFFPDAAHPLGLLQATLRPGDNPPIDPIREVHVMSLDTRIGSDLIVDSPILDQQQMRALEQALPDLQRVDVTFDRAQVFRALEAMERVCKEVRWDTELLRRLLCSAIAEHVNSGRLYPFCWRWQRMEGDGAGRTFSGSHRRGNGPGD